MVASSSPRRVTSALSSELPERCPVRVELRQPTSTRSQDDPRLLTHLALHGSRLPTRCSDQPDPAPAVPGCAGEQLDRSVLVHAQGGPAREHPGHDCLVRTPGLQARRDLGRGRDQTGGAAPTRSRAQQRELGAQRIPLSELTPEERQRALCACGRAAFVASSELRRRQGQQQVGALRRRQGAFVDPGSDEGDGVRSEARSEQRVASVHDEERLVQTERRIPLARLVEGVEGLGKVAAAERDHAAVVQGDHGLDRLTLGNEDLLRLTKVGRRILDATQGQGRQAHQVESARLPDAVAGFPETWQRDAKVCHGLAVTRQEEVVDVSSTHQDLGVGGRVGRCRCGALEVSEALRRPAGHHQCHAERGTRIGPATGVTSTVRQVRRPTQLRDGELEKPAVAQHYPLGLVGYGQHRRVAVGRDEVVGEHLGRCRVGDGQRKKVAHVGSLSLRSGHGDSSRGPASPLPC